MPLPSNLQSKSSILSRRQEPCNPENRRFPESPAGSWSLDRPIVNERRLSTSRLEGPLPLPVLGASATIPAARGPALLMETRRS